MFVPRSLARVLAPALALALGSTALSASADDRAIAQQAFQEARALMDAGRVAEACPKFAAAAALSPTAGVRLNLSDCYAKLGKTASAWSKADEALALAERAGDASAAGLARERKAALAAKLSYLTIAVSPDNAAGLELSLDGEKLPSAVWGTALPIDPGEHAIVASAPGHRDWTGKATVNGEASREAVEVPRLEADESAIAPVAGGSAPAPAEPKPASGTLRTVGLVVGGAGVVGLGVGTALGIMAGSKKSAYEEHQDASGRCVDRECVTLSQDALGLATGSTIGFIAGGALLATGAVLWFVAPSAAKADEAKQPSIALVPWAGNTMGAGVVGSW